MVLSNLSALVAALALLTTKVSARPRSLPAHTSRDASKGQNVVYWGADPHYNPDLGTYCTPDAGIDVLVLSFLDAKTDTLLYGTLGDCSISTNGTGEQCDALAADIQKCQAAGKTILLSIGGAISSISLTSDAQATTYGDAVWNMFGNPKTKTGPRPLGDTYVNGFDFDVEAAAGNMYYPAMIETLRGHFQEDSANKYYISGAPQCPIPEPNMGVIIQNATFDYLFVQFYNNPCSLPGTPDGAQFNYDDWMTFTATTPSKDAKIFVGVPASSDAATGYPDNGRYYVDSTDLATVVANCSTEARFGGVMMWAAGFSDANVINGLTYAQQVKSILNNGHVDGSGSPSGSASTAPSSSAALPSSSSVPSSVISTTYSAVASSSPVASVIVQSSSPLSSLAALSSSLPASSAAQDLTLSVTVTELGHSSALVPSSAATAVSSPSVISVPSSLGVNEAIPAPTRQASSTSSTAAAGAQCGGSGYTGDSSCPQGYTCQWSATGAYMATCVQSA